jgi:hypothetical protein
MVNDAQARLARSLEDLGGRRGRVSTVATHM